MLLLTGATGFLGSYLLYELFRRSYKIRAIKRKDRDFSQVELAFRVMNEDAAIGFDDYLNSIEWMEADLLDFSSFSEIITDVKEVYHAAAMVSFNKKNHRKIRDVNIQATADLLNLSMAADVEKFHFVSSISSLDRNDDFTTDEKAFGFNKVFRSKYSLSKFKAEMEVWRAYNEGLKGVIVNPGVIIGPVCGNHEISRIFNMIRKGFRYYTNGQNGYIDVRDVADFMVQLANKEEAQRQRYLMVAENISYRDVFEMIAASFGVKPPQKEAGKTLQKTLLVADTVRSMLTGKSSVVTKELIELITSRYDYRSDKIIGELGIAFRPVRQSVEDTCRFMMQNK